MSKDWVNIVKDSGYDLVEVLPTFIRYKPKVSFHGMSECFKGLDIKQVITDMNEIDEGVY